jgi:hypothetical protein
VFDGYDVAPTPLAAVAAKVPVNGEDDDARLVTPLELITVFAILPPLPPCWLNRFSICPFGATKFIVRSLIQALADIVALMSTLILVITAPEGNDDVTLLVTPAGVLSVTKSGPEEFNVNEPDRAVIAGAVKDCEVPGQTPVVAGVIVKDAGIGATVTVLTPLQPLTV